MTSIRREISVSEFVIWAERFEAMKLFYTELLQGEIEESSPDSIKISDGVHTIYLHRVPLEYLGELSSVAPARIEAPFKPIFVIDRDEVLRIVQQAKTIKTFTFEGAMHHDVADPDGNVICLRQLISG